jgi:hypothetical protein
MLCEDRRVLGSTGLMRDLGSTDLAQPPSFQAVCFLHSFTARHPAGSAPPRSAPSPDILSADSVASAVSHSVPSRHTWPPLKCLSRVFCGQLGFTVF